MAYVYIALQHAQYVLLFLVLAVKSKFYGVAHSYSSQTSLCTLGSVVGHKHNIQILLINMYMYLLLIKCWFCVWYSK